MSVLGCPRCICVTLKVSLEHSLPLKRAFIKHHCLSLVKTKNLIDIHRVVERIFVPLFSVST